MLPAHGARVLATSIPWTWSRPSWRGNICAGTRNIKPTGLAAPPAPPPSAGACDFAEDPRRDARQVRPLWISAGAAQLRAHVACSGGQTFSVWQLAGRKQLTLREQGGLILEAVHLAHRLRAWLDPAVHEGAAVELSIPLDDHLRTRLPAYQGQAAMLGGRRPPAQPREVSRAGLLHLRALQALDGQQHGASHRDIAEALFGADAVRTRWSADGELRAQVRHLLSRARAFLNGGYLGLAGASRKSASTETKARAHSLPPPFAPVS